MLKVSKEEERTLLLQKSWSWGPSGLILKKWHVDFNAQKEPHNLQQIWAILPGLPMIFQQKHILEGIGNKIGKFIKLEDNQEQKTDQRCARILIELDLRDGLFEEIIIKLHNSSCTQWLDYQKVPFQCFRCRQVRHMQKDCMLKPASIIQLTRRYGSE